MQHYDINELAKNLPAALLAMFQAQAAPQASKPQFRKDSLEAMKRAARERVTRVDQLSEKAQAILDCFHGWRMDAGESMFFARQLEFVRPGMFEVLYPALLAKQIMPVNNAVSPGAEQYTYRAYDKTGQAVVIKHYSDQSPRVDVFGKESVVQIRGVTDAYAYNLQELRAAMYAGLPLDVRKAMTAREIMERKIDDVGFYGDVAGGLLGLANLSSTYTYTVPTVGGSALWRNKSADQIANDIHGLVNGVVKNSDDIEHPDTVAMPLAAFTKIATIRMGDGSNQTVLDYVLKTSPYLKKIIPSYKLDGANYAKWSGTTNLSRMIAFADDPQKLELVIPQEFEQLPPDKKGFEYETVCHARTAGVVAYYPASIGYADGVTDNTD